jgi:hypothetical protein
MVGIVVLHAFMQYVTVDGIDYYCTEGTFSRRVPPYDRTMCAVSSICANVLARFTGERLCTLSVLSVKQSAQHGYRAKC